MPKEFITERDIEDLVKRGVTSLEVNDNVVLTDLAFEKANKLGIRLVQDAPANPPAAPVRPYLSQPQTTPVATYISGSSTVFSTGAPPVQSPQANAAELRDRIRNAVTTRLGTQVDSALLDTIITRVLNSTGVK
jgi:hypothetical protein